MMAAEGTRGDGEGRNRPPHDEEALLALRDVGPSLDAESLDLARWALGASEPLRRHLRVDPTLLSSPAPLAVLARDRSPRGLRRRRDAEIPPGLGHGRAEEALARWYRRALLTVAADEARGASVVQVGEDLSRLADAAIERALEIAVERVDSRLGAPLRPDGERCRHTLIGLGKLGSEELNYRSDVDVVLLFGTDEGATSRSGREIHAYHVELVRELTRIMEHRGGLGPVHRVDLGLRPEGRTGTLANSVDAAERFYETWGHTWERMAWLRARPVAGDPNLGLGFLLRMRPFIYRRHLDPVALRELATLKRTWSRADRSPGEIGAPGWDLKLGAGGIRSIELFVHTLQLVFGARRTELQTSSTLRAVDRLTWSGILTAREAETLRGAWSLLRRLENRVQMLEEVHTARLPGPAAAHEALARWCGFADGAALQAAIAESTAPIHEMLGSLLEPPPGEARAPAADSPCRDAPNDVLHALLAHVPRLDVPPGDAELSLLRARGLRRPRESALHLAWILRHGASPLRDPDPDPSRDDARLHLLRSALSAPDPDQALLHLRLLAERYTRYPTVVLGLGESRHRAQLAGTILGTAPQLARTVIDNARALEELLLGPLPARLPDRPEIEAALDRAGADDREDPEAVLAACRTVHETMRLRAGVCDFGRIAEPVAVGRALSDLADALLGRIAHAAMTSAGLDPEAELLCWLALGRYGGRAMDSGSDLDLVAVYRRRPGQGWPEVEKLIRAARRTLSWLSVPCGGRALYEVDTRLRPSGGQGVLVIDREGYERYYREEAAVWERLALLRARPVWCSGAEEAHREASRLLAELAHTPPDLPPAAHARKVESMRQRMRRERRKGGASALDLKMDPGGLVTADFLAALVQRTWGCSGNGAARWRSTEVVTVLEGLSEAPPEALAEEPSLAGLEEHWSVLLQAVTRLRWVAGDARHTLAPAAPETVQVAASLGHGHNPGALLDHLRATMDRIEQAYLRLLEILCALDLPPNPDPSP